MMDDGTLALLSGTCKKCGRPYDVHRYRFNGQMSDEPVCPRSDELVAGERPAPSQPLPPSDYLK